MFYVSLRSHQMQRLCMKFVLLEEHAPDPLHCWLLHSQNLGHFSSKNSSNSNKVVTIL